jgi:hypothetical protein
MSRKMHDGIRPRAGEGGLDARAVRQVALDELRAGIHSASMAFA